MSTPLGSIHRFGFVVFEVVQRVSRPEFRRKKRCQTVRDEAGGSSAGARLMRRSVGRVRSTGQQQRDRPARRLRPLRGLGQELQRVDQLSVHQDFVVKVSAGRAAGRAHIANHVAAFHGRTHADVELAHVSVARGQTEIVLQHDEIAVVAADRPPTRLFRRRSRRPDDPVRSRYSNTSLAGGGA